MSYLRRLSVTALLLALTSAGAVAQRRDPPPARGGFVVFTMMNADFDSFASRLALSPEQQTQLHALAAEFGASHEEPLGRMTAMLEELRSRRREGRLEPGTLEAVAARHGNPQQDLQPDLHGFVQSVERVLTEDQRAALARMAQARIGRQRR